MGKAEFVVTARLLDPRVATVEIVCQICVKRPAAHGERRWRSTPEPGTVAGTPTRSTCSASLLPE
ncbi:hypothetical protein [Nonomuraea sp. KM88]|uniref:hypothetical protein n=1 Tax=Nonomuraea sp. KM88 TaxID=3457427 RepID=UPI003FCCE0BF